MDRDQFLTRVREAARAGQAYRVHTQPTPAESAYVGAGDDLCLALATEIEAVGGQVEVVADDQAARQSIAQCLQSHGATAALCWQHPLLDRLGLSELLAAEQVAQHDFAALSQLDAADRRQLMLAAGIGISSVDFAVAETGTLVVCSRPGQERMASLLPPVHLAIVDESQIVPDLLDVFSHLSAVGAESLASNIAFITGPSKTGDIELQLTTGVHGPGTWRVLIIRNQG